MTTCTEPFLVSDQQLVERHLAGESSAFRQIVERHRGMVCALALSACGDVARSEDLAQEVFVIAWRQLPTLGEPEKLRAWLGGITRNQIRRSYRQSRTTPTDSADAVSPELPDAGLDPRTQAICADELSLLWSVVGGIPEAYREPLILFYRENQSVSEVAEILQLSEEAVRQRLSRGRTMLSERMSRRVEAVLLRTAPQLSFVHAVLLALPHSPAPVLAAGSMGGGMLAKGGLGLKLLATLAALPALITGFTDYLRFRAEIEAAVGSRQSEVIRRHVAPLVLNAAVTIAVGLCLWLAPFRGGNAIGFGIGVAVMVAGLAAFQRRRADAMTPAAAFEYRSSGGFLGLPWIHVKVGGRAGWMVSRGWIAISDGTALGGCFAGGPGAIAPLSVGNIALGALALGGIVVGWGGLGGVALGWWAAGGVAVGIKAAWGGVAIARDFAVGGVAIASYANKPAAHVFLGAHGFFLVVQSAWKVAVCAMFTAWIPTMALIGWRVCGSRRIAKTS